MTTGHKHRTIKVTRNSLLYRVLSKPTLLHDTDLDRLDASRFVFGPCPKHDDCYRLSPLGLLHGLTGLTLEMRD